jgi:hypothetical protein
MPPDRLPEHEAERAPDPGRARDWARVVTLLGVVLLMPPAVTLFVTDARIGGMPLIVAYLFAVWLALIGCARLLAHRLDPPPDPSRVTPAATDAGPTASRDSPPR